jgi:MFS family permease
VCGLTKFFGNLLYSIPINGYFPLFGRFISGIGEATIGVLYGAVTKCTTNKNRAKTFLYFEGLFSLGSILGPIRSAVFSYST